MKYEETTFKVVDYQEINKLIEDNFGFKEYNMVEIEELMNGIYKLFSIKPANEYDIDYVDKRKTLHSTRCYLNVLCTKGVIESGYYLVHISW